ncbi:hypothetical protein [Pyrobaculum ferrireducens]|uniref:PaREP5ab n=1 Tax=Pyrobaculum ferrireducens TaxID=1104324 RepID=G7VCB7_9CREN|nr:hypothetical protein [Pyrobaculum ferrireducens]AET32537.1 paREP5ab [Pyrobaculum ferrireducens]
MTLETKDIFTATEALHLKNVVRSLLPAPRSRYYTWEIYEKPKNILDKDLEEYTIADAEEINRMADLMETEGREAGRRELVEYSWKLRFFAMVVKVVYIYPKLVRKPRGPQPRGMSTASSG